MVEPTGIDPPASLTGSLLRTLYHQQCTSFPAGNSSLFQPVQPPDASISSGDLHLLRAIGRPPANGGYTILLRRIRINLMFHEPGKKISRFEAWLNILLLCAGVCLSRIFENLFPPGLAAIFLGKIHNLAMLNHPDGRAGLKADLQRSTCCAAQRFFRGNDIRIFRPVLLFRHQLSPDSMNLGSGPELSYRTQLLSNSRYTSWKLRSPASNGPDTHRQGIARCPGQFACQGGTASRTSRFPP